MLVLSLAIVAPSAAQAHEQAVTVSSIDIVDAPSGSTTIVWKVDVAIDDLAHFPQLTELARRPDESAVRAHAGAIGRALAPAASVVVDGGSALPVQIGATEPRFDPERRRIVAVVQTLTFAARQSFERVTLRTEFLGKAGAGHRTLTTVSWAGQSRRYARSAPGAIDVTRGRLFPSAAATFGEFLVWGTGHILVGWDHLAFLFCLILASRRPRDLLLMVTAFTLGHSLTLITAGLGAVHVTPRLADIGIALSVVYVAIENFVRGEKPAPTRWWLAGGFGLVHGLGLASDLSNRLDDAGPRLIAAVLAFNVGIELGQILVGGVMFVALTWARRSGRPLVRVASLPVLLLGLYWLIARSVG